MQYKIPIVSGKPDWDQLHQVPVASYLWSQGYAPETNASVILWAQAGTGIIVRMECREADPMATYRKNNTPVWEDSCLACFLNFDPEATDAYIAIWANANGAMYSDYGSGPDARIQFSEMQCAPPAVQIHRLADRWVCYFIIPMQTIHSLYGKLWFLPGDKLRGNFYKCGEKTPQPHWGSWTKLSGDTPQLHQPAYFGDLEIDTTRL